MIYRTADKMADEKKQIIRQSAKKFLDNLN